MTPTLSDVFRQPEDFARILIKIQDKQGEVRPLVYNRAQRIYLHNRTRYDIILKARQLGFSTAILAEFFRIASTRSAMLNTITDKGENTQNFRRKRDKFLEHLPSDIRPPVKINNDFVSTYPTTQSEWKISTAGAKNVGRSTTNTHIHASEVAFWKDMRGVLKSLMEAGDPAIVYESTPNGAYGEFFNLCMETLNGREHVDRYFVDGPNGHRLFFFPWWVNPEYTAPAPPLLDTAWAPDQDERINRWGLTSEGELMARHGLSQEQINWRRWRVLRLKDEFVQEYAEDPISCFLASGASYFGDLSGAFLVGMREPQEDHRRRYFAGLDFGQDNDYTVCVIYDRKAREFVDIYRARRQPWADMRAEIVALCNRWGISLLVGEKNSMGSTNLELLRDKLGQDRVQDFETTNASKAEIMAHLKEGIHSDGVKLLNRPIVRMEMGMYQRIALPGGGWRFTAPAQMIEGEEVHDDIVIATALAYHAAQRDGVSVVEDHYPMKRRSRR